MKFSEFGKEAGSPKAPEPTLVIDGTFGCQTCDLTCDEAEYFQPEKILRWKCAEGHVSFIEEFRL